jgi:NNP family nitrate/nitrite transporter-like MFS transporter
VAAGVVALLVVQEAAVFRVNRPALRDSYPPGDRYPFRNVAALCVAYFASFGSELAVVTILPTFFADTWGLGPAAAGLAASGFAFMNLVARPGGGILSDLLGSRKRTLSALCAGLVAGYLLLATLGSAWPWALAVVACMVCSFFVQASEGAVFAIVPLVKKRVSGQIAGITGAYGNVGALVFLTIGILASTRVVFLAMAGAALVAFLVSRVVVEPDNSFADDLLTDSLAGEPPGAPAPVPAAAEPVPAQAD